MQEEYRIAKGWRIFAYIFSPIMGAVGIYLVLMPFLENKDGVAGFIIFCPMGLFLVALGIGGTLDAHRSKLIIGPDSLTKKGVFKEKEIPVAEVKGFRRDGKFTHIIPKDKTYPNIRINGYMERPGELNALLEDRFTDLDQETILQEQKELMENESLGDSREAREERLGKVRKLTKVLSIVGIADFLWLIIQPVPYTTAIYVSMSFLFICFFVLHRNRELISIEEKKNSTYPSLSVALIMPSLGLALRAVLDYQFIEYGPLLLLSVFFGLLLTLLLWYCSGSFIIRGRVLRTSYYLIFLGAYSYGACAQINCLEDKGQASVYPSRILDKRISKGKTTTYYLNLSPWGPKKEAEDESVPKSLYNRVGRGETVRVYLRTGYLYFPWYYVGK